MKYKGGGFMKKIVLALAVVIVYMLVCGQSGCAHMQANPENVSDTDVAMLPTEIQTGNFTASYDKVFLAVQDALESENYILDSIDKANGRITTKPEANGLGAKTNLVVKIRTTSTCVSVKWTMAILAEVTNAFGVVQASNQAVNPVAPERQAKWNTAVYKLLNN
jgi:hypothetical protein